MAGKRKRNRRSSCVDESPPKRVKAISVTARSSIVLTAASDVQHPVLSLYYPRVVTLRQYLLSRLPVASKARRRRLVTLGQRPREYGSACAPDLGQMTPCEDSTRLPDRTTACSTDPDDDLAHLLDGTLVCGANGSHASPDPSRLDDRIAFSQQQQRSTGASSLGSQNCSQSEVGDLFS